MCNHPELFERREAKSPYFFNPEPYVLPKFLFRHGLLHSAFPSRHHLLTGRFSIWAPEHIHNSLFHGESQVTDETHTISNTFASFSRLMGLSPGDLYHIMNNGQLTRYLYILCIFFSISPVSEIYLRNWKILFLSSLKYGCEVLALERNLHHNSTWEHSMKPHLLIQPFDKLSHSSLASSNILASMVFTSPIGSGYAHLDHELQSMPETIEHRILRSRKAKTPDAPEFIFKSHPSKILPTIWTNFPKLLIQSVIKV